MNVAYNAITKDTPILLGSSKEINDFIEALNIAGSKTPILDKNSNSELFFYKVSFGNLKYLIVNTDFTKTLLGKDIPDDILTAMFAMYSAQEYDKITDHESLLLKAMEYVLKNEQFKAYSILKDKYYSAGYSKDLDKIFDIDEPGEIDDQVFTVKEQVLKEDPDSVLYEPGKRILYTSRDARPFLFHKRTMKCFVGDKGGMHWWHSFKENYPEEYEEFPGDRKSPDVMFAGRFWQAHKIISFWQYPKVSQLKSILKKIQDESKRLGIGINFDSGDWQIDVPNNAHIKTGSLEDYTNDEMLFPLKDVLSGKASRESHFEWFKLGQEVAQKNIDVQHIISPVLKKKQRQLDPVTRRKLVDYFRSQDQGELDSDEKAFYHLLRTMS